MFWTLMYILLPAAMIAAIRPAAWRGVLLASRLFCKMATILRQVGAREGISKNNSRLKASFPETFRVLQARLTPTRHTGLPLTIMVITAVAIAALLGWLVGELLKADDLLRVDEWINRRMDPLRRDGAITIFIWITDLGGTAALTAVAFATTGLLWVHGPRLMIAPLWLTFLGSQIAVYAGKYLLMRERPEFVTEVGALTPSFPSAHATSAMAVYGIIVYIIARSLATTRQRFEIIYWAAVLIGLIGFSRMLLSVHYASDVVAGFLLGGFWLLLGIALAEHKRS